MTRIFFVLILLIAGIACSQRPTPAVSDVQQRIDSLLQRINAPQFAATDFTITDYGAVANATTDSKPAIDTAIARCLQAGGGRVVIPPGIFFVDGPIHMVSNMNLHLAEGATLRFGSRPEAYLPVVKTSWEGTLLYNYSPFIYAIGQQNIAITGSGTIDGEASETWAKWHAIQKDDQLLSREMNHNNTPVEQRIFGAGHYLRPHLVQFFECKNILVEGVTIEDSPFWCVHLLKCSNATLRKLRYDAQNKNNDGIDAEYSHDILMEDITFDNNDDNIVIKAGRDHEGRATNRPSHDMLARNCSFKGLHAVVVGSEMSAGVENIYVKNCRSHGYLKRGIYLKSNPDRGGFIRNIYVDSIAFGKVLDCFMVTSNYHNEGLDNPSEISNINISNISCTKADNYAIYIKGHKLKSVGEFSITNFAVNESKKGIYIDFAENIELNNVTTNGKRQTRQIELQRQNTTTDRDY